MHPDPEDPALRKDTWPFPETVAHVSTSWRQISFDDSQLWGRIDIDIAKEPGERAYKDAKARLEYARDSCLNVRIHQNYASSSIGTKATIQFLEQIAPRLGAISCRSTDYWHLDLMADTLVSWLQHGKICTLSELHLFRHPDNRGSSDLRRKLAKNLPMARVEDWLTSVRHLTLHHVFIDWSSHVYHNLVELNLWFDMYSHDRIPIEQFAGVLSASPTLRILKLCGLALSSRSASSRPEPVRLDELEVFFLKDIRDDTIEMLLPLLQLGSTPLYMTFGGNKVDYDLPSYMPFLKRSPIAKLMIRGCGDPVPSELCTVLSVAQHLVLDGLVFEAGFFSRMKLPLVRQNNIVYPTVWPHLRTLHLVRCSFIDFVEKGGRFKKPIPYDFMMWLSGCRFWGEQGIRPLGTESDSVDAQEVLQAITSYVPGMQGASEFESPFLVNAWKSALEFSADTVL